MANSPQGVPSLAGICRHHPLKILATIFTLLILAVTGCKKEEVTIAPVPVSAKPIEWEYKTVPSNTRIYDALNHYGKSGWEAVAKGADGTLMKRVKGDKRPDDLQLEVTELVTSKIFNDHQQQFPSKANFRVGSATNGFTIYTERDQVEDSLSWAFWGEMIRVMRTNCTFVTDPPLEHPVFTPQQVPQKLTEMLVSARAEVVELIEMRFKRGELFPQTHEKLVEMATSATNLLQVHNVLKKAVELGK